MRLINIFAILSIIVSVAFAAPTVERTSPTTITVTGDYAFLDEGPGLFVVSTGDLLIDSLVWNEGGVIEYTVLPDSEYTVHAFTFDPENPDVRDSVTIVVPALIPEEPTLDDIMYELVKSQRRLREMNDSGEINFFDISDSMQRAMVKLDAEIAIVDQ